MDCNQWTEELVECARRGAELPKRLSLHLSECRRCRDFWSAQQSLAPAIQAFRAALAGERSSEAGRNRLLAEFAKLEDTQPRLWIRWAWGVAATALLALVLLPAWRLAPGRSAISQPAISDDEEFADSAVGDGNEGSFIPLPFVAPMAAGESVEIVRTELNGAELARMGIDLPVGFDEEFDADLVLGEDGSPRAVKLLGYQDF